MEDRKSLCGKIIKLELSEVENSLKLFEKLGDKPGDEYLYALAFEKSENARQLAEYRNSICGERHVSDPRKPKRGRK